MNMCTGKTDRLVKVTDVVDDCSDLANNTSRKCICPKFHFAKCICQKFKLYFYKTDRLVKLTDEVDGLGE